MDPIDQMRALIRGLESKRLLYRNLVADNGWSAVAG